LAESLRLIAFFDFVVITGSPDSIQAVDCRSRT